MIVKINSIEYFMEACCSCGILFFLSQAHKEDLSDKGRSFYCPNGHSQFYTESSAVKISKLKSSLAVKENIVINLEKEVESLNKKLKRKSKKK